MNPGSNSRKNYEKELQEKSLLELLEESKKGLTQSSCRRPTRKPWGNFRLNISKNPGRNLGIPQERNPFEISEGVFFRINYFENFSRSAFRDSSKNSFCDSFRSFFCNSSRSSFGDFSRSSFWDSSF